MAAEGKALVWIDGGLHASEVAHGQHTMQLAYELSRAGKPFRLMLYPKSRHGVSDPALNKHIRATMLAFIEETLRQMEGIETGRVLWTDGPLEPAQFGIEFAEQLHFAGPWCQGFPEPLCDNTFAVLDRVVLRDAHLRLSLRHSAGGEPLEAIAFNETRELSADARFLYRLGINDFNGRRRRQLVVEHIECE